MTVFVNFMTQRTEKVPKRFTNGQIPVRNT